MNVRVSMWFRLGFRHIEYDCGPRRNFSAQTFKPAHKALGNALLFCQLQLRCITPNSGPQASSPLNEQRKTWSIFAKQIEIFQVKAWLANFKARNANLNLLDGDVEKGKKTRSTCGGRSRPPPSIDRRSPQPRSLQVSFQICRVLFL